MSAQPILPVRQSLFGLLGGPGAWFIQLCVGYLLTSGPCFPHDNRRLSALAGFAWTWPTSIALSLFAVLLGIAACSVSWGILRRTQIEARADRPLPEDVSRTRFLALWGMVLGAGFALASLVTGIGFIALPRCAG
jgi:hypothetical protein